MTWREKCASFLSVPPIAMDEASYRQTEVLHIAHLSVFFGGFLYFFVPSWILNGQPVYVAVTVLIAVVGHLLLRAGMLRVSGIWTTGVMWLMFTVGSSTEGGISSGSFAGTLAMVVFSGLAYGVGAMMTLSAMTVGAGAVLVYLKMHNLLPEPSIEYSHLNILADYTVYSVITVLYMRVAIRRVDTSTHRFESELKERKKAEEAMLQTQALYRSFVEHLPAGVFRKDGEGRYNFVNSRFCQLRGLKAEEILGKTRAELMQYETGMEQGRRAEGTFRGEPPVVQVVDHHAQIMNNGQPVEVEEVHTMPDGSIRHLNVVKSPVFSSDGTVIGSQGIQFDITEHKSLERQLIQVQKLEGIGTLAGGIAHDFNNLLAMILGSAEMLKMNMPDDFVLKKYVERIIEASERGTSISRQLLIFSRPEETDFKHIALSPIIRELREMLTHFLSKSIAIRTEVDPTERIIRADAGQIHQAILNLALNAGDAMPDGGTLTIREFMADAELMRQKFGTEPTKPFVALSVTDNGSGMDASTVGKIFDPFFTTKEKGKGTGLGLSIVHGIVKSHEGYIDVESVVHEGTTFTMYFPCVLTAAHVHEAATDSSRTTGGGTILLADDEEMIRQMLSEFLTREGYDVLTASNGAEALELYTVHRTSIRLVITDLGMPQMGGEELFQRLHAINPSVIVIASSGYLEGTTKNDLRKIGFTGILKKPYKMQDIRMAVHAALDASAPGNA